MGFGRIRVCRDRFFWKGLDIYIEIRRSNADDGVQRVSIFQVLKWVNGFKFWIGLGGIEGVGV